MPKVSEIGINPNYLIGNNLANTTYYDNFQLESERLTKDIEPKDLMIAFFLSFPKSFTFLLNTREFIAKYLGLKTAEKPNKKTKYEKLYALKGEIGEKIAVFEVLDKSEIELMTGQKDSHLDFKLSFIVYQKNGKTVLELPTTVIINNKLGKVYFSIVKPIHKFYLKRILKRMEGNLITLKSN